MAEKRVFSKSLFIISVLVSLTYSFYIKDDTTVSQFVISYVAKIMPNAFWPHPDWSKKDAVNTNKYWFYTIGNFDNDSTVDAASAIIQYTNFQNQIQLCALPTIFFFSNGIVKEHAILDTIAIELKPARCGLAINTGNMQLLTLPPGLYNSNCGGEHNVKLESVSLKIKTELVSYGYTYYKGNFHKTCLFLD